MGLKLEAPVGVTRDHSGNKRHVAVNLSRLAFDSLAGAAAGPGGQMSAKMEGALRVYLADRDRERPAWLYPRFLEGAETRADVRLDLDLEDGLWGEFEEEASTQGVSVDQLAEHAAFYFAAEATAGHLTERILEDLEDGRDDVDA